MKKSKIPKMAMSVADLGETLGLSRDASYRLANKIGVKVGGRLLVPVRAVEELLEREPQQHASGTRAE
jgi:hypothetical protein